MRFPCISLLMIVFLSQARAEPQPGMSGWQGYLQSGERLEQQGLYRQAKEQFGLALDAIGSSRRGSEPEFRAEIHLAVVTAQLGEYTEAERWGNQAIRTGTALHGAEDVALAVPLLNLAIVYRDQNNYTRAEQTSRRILELLAAHGSDQPAALAATLGILGTVIARRGELQKAEELLREGIRSADKLHGPDRSVLAENLSSLASLCRNTGRQREAESLLGRAYAVYEQVYGMEHPELVPILRALATLQADSGNYSEALREDERAVQLAEKAWGPNHPQIRDALLEEASWLRKLHRKHEARALEARAQKIQEANAQNSLARYTVDARDVAALRSGNRHP